VRKAQAGAGAEQQDVEFAQRHRLLAVCNPDSRQPHKDRGDFVGMVA
jgi:hypothetical protein